MLKNLNKRVSVNQIQNIQQKSDLSRFYFSEDDQTIDAMLKAGVHFGHKASKWHPSMKEYIYLERGGIHIIDLVKTIELFNRAVDALYGYALKGEVLFVGTKPQAKDIVKSAAIRSKSHFIIHRWPGGLLTNHENIKKSIRKLDDYLRAFKEGIENRTKKELLIMKSELNRLFNLYGGVRNLNGKPACLIVVDAKKSRIAIKEAYKMGVPVIAMIDTNSSTNMIQHLIPSNDDSLGSIDLIINKLADVVLAANGGRGVNYEEIDINEISNAIENMAKILAAKKYRQVEQDPNKQNLRKPKVVRVTKEQVNKVVKV